MTTRITRRDAEQALMVFCVRAGLPHGHYVHSDAGTPTIEVHQVGGTYTAHHLSGKTYVLTGGLALSGAYGGWQVHRIIGLDGTDPNRDGQVCTGVRTPFGGGYRPAREIVTMLNGASSALEIVDRSQR